MDAYRFGCELALAVAFVVPRTLAHRGDSGIVEAIRPSGVAANIFTGDECAEDAVDCGAGVSGHALEIFDAEACTGLTERLNHVNGLEHAWDKITGIPGMVRFLKHLDPPPRSDFVGAQFMPGRCSVFRLLFCLAKTDGIVRHAGAGLIETG
jgi:hypothetical protein